MANTISQNGKLKLDQILQEVQLMRNQLQKFLVFIPEESIKEYKNGGQIKKAHLMALQKYPPK
ncbi:MAG: hypothetical protein AAB451_00325 [Patescibacteria group bacterium]